MKLERVQQGTAETIHVTFTQDGVAADPSPDSATVTVTSSDGTELSSGPAYDEGEGAFSYTLTPTELADLDTLTVAWTVTYGDYEQTLETTVEVVGGFVFTLADARAMKPFDGLLNDGTTYRYSTESIVAMRVEVERALEYELGFAMVPRYTSETLDGDGGHAFMLSQPYPRTIRSATVTGLALTDAQIATLAVSPSGRLYYPSAWTRGYSNVVIGYEHGLTSPPPGAKHVALALLKRWLTGAPADDRATTMTTDEQTTTFYVPGAGEPFDVPAANRFVRAHSLRTGIA